MAFCVHCGSALPARAGYCASCGERAQRADVPSGDSKAAPFAVQSTEPLRTLQRVLQRIPLRSTGILSILLVAVLLGMVAAGILLGRTEGFVDGQSAVCLDPSGDEVEVRGPFHRMETFPTHAPDFDIRVIELAAAGDQLLVRVALEGEWRRDDLFTSFLQHAQVNLIKEGALTYVVQLSLADGVRLNRWQPRGFSELLADGLPIGHEGNVVEGHVPLAKVNDLGGSFEFWGFVSGVVGSKVIEDYCASEDAPIAFPAGRRAPQLLPTTEVPDTPVPTQSETDLDPSDCPRRPTERIGAEQAAKCFYEAWTINDRDLARIYGSERAVATIFEYPYGPPGAEFLGCQDGDPPTCDYYFEDEPHGVLMVFELGGTPSAGYSVESVEFMG